MVATTRVTLAAVAASLVTIGQVRACLYRGDSTLGNEARPSYSVLRCQETRDSFDTVRSLAYRHARRRNQRTGPSRSKAGDGSGGLGALRSPFGFFFKEPVQQEEEEECAEVSRGI